jgi:hypothetical protein
MKTVVERPCAGFKHMIASNDEAVYGTRRFRGRDGRFRSKTGIWCNQHRTDPSPTFTVIGRGLLIALVERYDL